MPYLPVRLLISIQISFLGMVYPTIVITYLGQGARLVIDPENVIENIYYRSIPGPINGGLYWSVVLSHLNYAKADFKLKGHVCFCLPRHRTCIGTLTHNVCGLTEMAAHCFASHDYRDVQSFAAAHRNAMFPAASTQLHLENDAGAGVHPHSQLASYDWRNHRGRGFHRPARHHECIRFRGGHGYGVDNTAHIHTHSTHQETLDLVITHLPCCLWLPRRLVLGRVAKEGASRCLGALDNRGLSVSPFESVAFMYSPWASSLLMTLWAWGKVRVTSQSQALSVLTPLQSLENMFDKSTRQNLSDFIFIDNSISDDESDIFDYEYSGGPKLSYLAKPINSLIQQHDISNGSTSEEMEMVPDKRILPRMRNCAIFYKLAEGKGVPQSFVCKCLDFIVFLAHVLP